MPAAQLLHETRILKDSWIDALPRWGDNHPGWYFPASHMLKLDLREVFADVIPNDADFVECFHGLYRIGLVQQTMQDVPGAYRAAPFICLDRAR
jgi:hypothetical protein